MRNAGVRGGLPSEVSSSSSNRLINVLLKGRHSALLVQALQGVGKLSHEALVVAQVVTEQVGNAEEDHGVLATLACQRRKLLGERVVDLVILALLVPAIQVTEPASSSQSQTAERAACDDLLSNRGHDELRKLARTTEADTGDLILKSGVAETLDEGLAVLVGVDTRNLGQQRLDLLVHHLVDVLAEPGVTNDFVNVFEATKECEVGHSRVASVQQTKLHEFELLNVVDLLHDLDTDLLERWAAVGELVLDDPLLERLSDDGPCVLNAELLSKVGDVLGNGAGCDAVDHAVGESAVLLEPLSDLRVAVTRECQHHVAGDVAVLLHVVARQNSEGLQSGCMTLLKRGVDEAKECAGSTLARQVSDHVGVADVELVGVLVVVVAALRDGHGNDVGVGVSHLVDDSLAVVGCEEVVGDTTNDVCLGASSGALNDGVEVVLGNESVTHLSIERLHTDTADGPVLQALVEQVVNVDSQVGPVEAADSDVDNALLDILTLVVRAGDLLQISQVLAVELQRGGNAVRHCGCGL
jgi:hypothetical protein